MGGSATCGSKVCGFCSQVSTEEPAARSSTWCCAGADPPNSAPLFLRAWRTDDGTPACLTLSPTRGTQNLYVAVMCRWFARHQTGLSPNAHLHAHPSPRESAGGLNSPCLTCRHACFVCAGHDAKHRPCMGCMPQALRATRTPRDCTHMPRCQGRPAVAASLACSPLVA